MCVGSIQYGGIETFWDRKIAYEFLFDFFVQKVSKISNNLL